MSFGYLYAYHSGILRLSLLVLICLNHIDLSTLAIYSYTMKLFLYTFNYLLITHSFFVFYIFDF